MLRDRENRFIRQLLSFAGEAASGAIDLLYPPLCLHCDGRIASSSVLCRSCRNRLETVDPSSLDRLLERLETDWIDDAIAVWYFDKGSPLQDVQHALKYGNRPRCGVWMGTRLGRACIDAMAQLPDIISPIPLHRTRLLERGYNQSTSIARAVGRMLDRPVDAGLLKRNCATQTQTNLSRAERRENLAGVFGTTSPEVATSRHVLVIDDVMTTGATFESAAIALKASGARRVTAAAVGLARN